MSTFTPKHFLWSEASKVATITLNRPEKKNPLTFESYAELRDTFRALSEIDHIKSVIIRGAGGNFCSGGDVHEIIAPLTKMNSDELLKFTTMTGDLIKAIKAAPQVVISAVEGICVGAGACVAMASDLRYGTPDSKVAFLFVKVGLAGCDMGACSILPRIIGHGRAAELFYTGRNMTGDEALNYGFYSELFSPDALYTEVEERVKKIAEGPALAHAMTKRMLDLEWSMPVNDAITAEAKAQASCMQTKDFIRAYEAFVAKERPKFEGN